MVYNLSSMSPRPRTIDDRAIPQSTARVIGRVGPVKLTLALVADEVGLSHPSIARYEPHRRNRCRGGCRFTSEAFTGALKAHGVRISMDGKGRWLDNVYVERLWRSLKQEEVYRRAYETVSEAGKGIADYLRYFNEERPHQGLDNRTPDDVFYKRKPLFKAA